MLENWDKNNMGNIANSSIGAGERIRKELMRDNNESVEEGWMWKGRSIKL